ncbi:MAG TPA: hypothetical protein VM389_07195 [Phycisphaerae bacterium]|nr:hypothetical protein [Phycisphaerae bacterium]
MVEQEPKPPQDESPAEDAAESADTRPAANAPEQGVEAADALQSMAEGIEPTAEDLREVEEYFEADDVEDAASPLAIMQGETAESASDPVLMSAGLPGAAGPAAQAARLRRHGRLASQAHAHQFKRFMIPLLLVTGVLLFVLGGAALALQGSLESAETAGQGSLLASKSARWSAVAAFPLGAILLLGAWLFRRDVRRAEKGAR